MLEEIGKILREERERQGKTLEDIHNALKISIHNLKAIEEGDLGLLPHPVYVKGFIKNYADFLGLDGDELSQKFLQSCELVDEDEDRVGEFEDTEKRKMFWAIGFSCVLLIFLFVLAYIALKSRNLKEMPQVLEQNIEISKKEPEKSSKVLEKKDNNIQKSKQLINSISVSKKEKEEKREEIKEEESKKESSIKETSPINLEHELKISAFEPCWLRAEIDEKTKEYFLRKGDVLILKFKKSLKVKLGNAGGVNLEYDGEKVPLKAKSGEVRIIGFP